MLGQLPPPDLQRLLAQVAAARDLVGTIASALGDGGREIRVDDSMAELACWTADHLADLVAQLRQQVADLSRRVPGGGRPASGSSMSDCSTEAGDDDRWTTSDDHWATEAASFDSEASELQDAAHDGIGALDV